MKATPALATIACSACLATMEDELSLMEVNDKQVAQEQKKLLYDQVEELK